MLNAAVGLWSSSQIQRFSSWWKHSIHLNFTAVNCCLMSSFPFDFNMKKAEAFFSARVPLFSLCLATLPSVCKDNKLLSQLMRCCECTTGGSSSPLPLIQVASWWTHKTTLPSWLHWVECHLLIKKIQFGITGSFCVSDLLERRLQTLHSWTA